MRDNIKGRTQHGATFFHAQIEASQCDTPRPFVPPIVFLTTNTKIGK